MTDTTTPERPTRSDMLDSLTGYDEIAIAKAFDRDFAVLLDYPTQLARALVFVEKRRSESLSDKDAKAAAMGMRLGEVNSYFPDEPEQPEIDPDAPETPLGEGDSQPV